MFALFGRRAIMATGAVLLHVSAATSQQNPPDAGGLEIVVTPNRAPSSLQRSGSAVTVLGETEIARANPKSVADLLRQVPGLDVTETGGPGQTTSVRLRGADTRHTLVLIDGVRVNDPSDGGAAFDFSNLVPTDIERIEVLRGPQSALYGSDAIGGVINVVTRKGRGASRAYASLESGRYATTAGQAGVSGAAGDVAFALSATGVASSGFSTFGSRIGRIERARALPLENDGYQRAGGSLRLSWRPAPGVELEAGLTSSLNNAQFDAAFGAFPDTPHDAFQRLSTGFVRGAFDAFDGRLTNTVTLSANRTDREFRQLGLTNLGARTVPDFARFGFVGDQAAVEYQGDLRLDAFGRVIFGAKLEEERLRTTTIPLDSPFTRAAREKADQATRSVFLLHQLPIGERLDLSLGGRLDDVSDVDTFATWRATAAYRIPEFGTKLRASAGTGAKAPALFQLFSPQFGTRTLQPERSFGVDAGFDQSLFAGRASLSVTVFAQRIRDLIEFSPFDTGTFTFPSCPVAQASNGCFRNVGRAEIFGVELGGDATVIEGLLTARGTFTFLDARDRDTNLKLARRPELSARLSTLITPFERFSIEPVLFLVGERFSSANEVSRLAPYARVDVRADYEVHKNLAVFGRIENITDARYQEVRDYGTTGRAFYGGVRATW